MAGIQRIVLTEITEFPFSRNLKSSSSAALAADTDASGAETAVAEYGNAARADPVAAAVMLLLLFLQTFQKHFLDLLLGKSLVLHGSCHIEILAGFFLGIFQPVHQLFGDLIRKFHILEKFQKSRIEFIKIRFAFYQNASAEIIEACKGGMMQSHIQCFDKGHPFIQRNVQSSCTGQIEK